MKRADLKNCAICGKGLMHSGSPLFYRVKIERMGFDAVAVQQTHGLETFFGGGQAGAMLANVMGPDPDIAKSISSDEALICDSCAMESTCLAAIHERIAKDEEVEEDDSDITETYCDCTNEDCDFQYQTMNPGDPCPKCGSKVKTSYIII